MLITAPAGYGKTTLLAQWAEIDPRRFAWMTVAEVDRDPVTLLGHLAAALERAGVDCSNVTAAFARGDVASLSSALRGAVASLQAPIVIVLDDAHRLTSTRVQQALIAVLGDLDGGAQLVLAGRRHTALTRRLSRSSPGALELGVVDLQMTVSQAAALLLAEEVELPEPSLAEIHRHVEGWPAGLTLAALALRAERHRGVERIEFDGVDRIVGDYLREELLSGLSGSDLELLRRVSALNRTCAPLCDSTLATRGSGERLDRLARSDIVTASVGAPPCAVAGRRCYRLNPMVRQALRSELERHEPEALADLRHRASVWSAANGRLYGAIDYAVRAGDRERVIGLLEAEQPRPVDGDSIGVLEACLELLDDGHTLERHPAVAMLGARMHAVAGRVEAAERFRCLAERGFQRVQSQLLHAPAVSVTRAAMCCHGIATMRADATLAVRSSAEGTSWHADALFLLGIAELLGGNPDVATELFEQAAAAGAACGAADVESAALAELSLLAASAGRWSQASSLAIHARSAALDAGLDPAAFTRLPPSSALTWVAAARGAAHAGDQRECRRELERSRALLPRLNDAVPWLGGQVRIELARVHLSLGEPASASELLDQVDDLLARRPGLGAIPTQAAELRGRIAQVEESVSGRPATLTRAERKLLPLLMTHRTLREIAATLDISRNTVKSQAISLYRKLGVSSRSDAIAVAAELGLVDPLRPPGRFDGGPPARTKAGAPR